MPEYLETLLKNQDYSKNKGIYNFKSINKKIRLKFIKERRVGYVIDNKVFILIGAGTKTGANIKFTDKLTNYKALKENPTREKYAEISAEISGMDKDFFIDLYDYANQKSFKKTWEDNFTGLVSKERYGKLSKEAKATAKAEPKEKPKAKPKAEPKMRGGKTGEEIIVPDIKNIPIEDRPRTLDPEKFYDSAGKIKKGFVDIGGKVLRKDLLEKGEFGYVLRGKLFPIFKVDKIPVASNSWSFVENKMLPQEKELFKRMTSLEDDDAISLYLDYFENYNIPKEVIVEALNLSNNDFTKKKIRNLEKNFGEQSVKNGFNINYSGQGIFESIIGTFTQKISETKKSVENRKTMSMNQEEINNLFTNTLKFNERRKLGSSGDTSQSDGVITKEELEVEIDADGVVIPPPPPLPEETKVPEPQATPPQPQAAPQAAAPPPPPPVNNIQMDINEQIKGETLRLDEREKIAEQEEGMQEELEKDNIADISKYGHQLAVQNIFKKNNKDFTYFKNLVSSNKSLQPSQDKAKRKAITDITIAEYSSLFPIEKLNSDYDYDECLEIATFKFGYVENVRFERKWKKSIGNMNIGTPGNTEGLSAGAIVNLENMGLNVNQLLNQKTTPTQSSSVSPPVAPTDPKKRETAGRVQRLRDYNIIRPPQNLKNKSTKKKRDIKFKDVDMNIRMKTINDRLLFTNLNHNPQQQNLEIPGDLPSFNFRENNKNNRFKF